MRKMLALRRKVLIDIVKQAPTFAVNFSVAGVGVKAVGHTRFMIAKDFASDPMLTDETVNGKALMERAWDKYIHATADVSAPVALLAHIAGNARISRLQTKGILVRNGANYSLHASYEHGEWIVNGKKFHPAARLRPAAGQRLNRQTDASATRS